MPFLIGTDEAGYGPNLGPLVISATVWHVPSDPGEIDLYARLDSAVRGPGAGRGDQRLAIADSKQLYKPGASWEALERGVLTPLGALGQHPECWRDVWATLVPGITEVLDKIPWYRDFNAPIPKDLQRHELQPSVESFQDGLKDADVVLRAVRSVAIFPTQWNQRLDECDSKGEVLALETLHLVRRLVEELEPENLLIQCDKFGGRNRYASLLQSVFDDFIHVIRESRPLSVYRWTRQQQNVECRFLAKGERYLPSALASMTSKYLRELAMLAFNKYWAERLPGVKPTAGYPVDARRFRDDIAQIRTVLAISDNMLWRRK